MRETDREKERKRVRGVTSLGSGGGGGFSKEDWRLTSWIFLVELPWFLHFLQMIVVSKRHTLKQILVY